MTAHLLVVTLGPVQEFIAQARRTRDLWYGSHLLSELSRAAARELLAGGADLVFPALQKGDPQLDECLAPLRDDGTPPLKIANKLLAEVPAGVDPKKLALEVREAVMRFWRDSIAAPVKTKCAGLLAGNINNVWDEQIDTFVEFTAAWAPLDDYAESRREVEAAIVARKNLRDFSPWRQQRRNVPKSSLDGARETVLADPQKRNATLSQKYRIVDSEQLDAIGLIKRAGGEPGQFVPVVNVAFASWIARADKDAQSELNVLKVACKQVGLSRVNRPDLPCAKPFPFDASVLLSSRWRAVFEEQGLTGDPNQWGKNNVRPLLDVLGEPYPYVACLIADGDHMGKAIDLISSAEAHRAFSRALSSFAADARRIVEQDHKGLLVYSGGDDVLAFLPLPEAPACAEDLRQKFSNVIASACSAMPSDEQPTLSVGLGIGHVMESMGELLELGREAERLAKKQRNSLAVVVDKRSGGKRSWTSSWNVDPAGRLQDDAEVLAANLSSGKVYEIAATLRRLPAPEAAADDGSWARVLALEVGRSLSRAAEGAITPDHVGLKLASGSSYKELYTEVSEWVDRMLIALTLGRATPRASRTVAVTA